MKICKIYKYVICLPMEHQRTCSSQELVQKCPCIPGSNWNLEILVLFPVCTANKYLVLTECIKLSLIHFLVFWNFVKGHLEKLEVDRFLALEKATTDAGRGQY